MVKRITWSACLLFLLALFALLDAVGTFSEVSADQDTHEHSEGDGHDHASEQPKAETPGHDDHDDHSDHGGESDEHGAVRLSQAEMDEFGIILDVAGPGTIVSTLELPGEVVPNADRLAHIVPRFPGIATEVRARIGDYVRKGEVLAIIESDESLAPFEVKTLISGTIIAKHITMGEAASRDRDAFVIADLSSVWVDVTVYQRDLGIVKVGQQAQVFVGHQLAHETGTISYITPIVDEHSRTATARLVLPNSESFWRPGMFVTVGVTVETADVPVAVPGTALQTYEDVTVVFIETDEGLKPQPVVLGRYHQNLYEVVEGLQPGDRYVRTGGFTLKAELEKEAFGDGHAH
ncbi:MAG: HlyD family efflux transporter periplasmic adaptor subunit [Gemmatimonadetes bacterium]|nr:HlyD family efflux transporter periplasmic adaptor subunit [Gemmatimonadota bacterium]